jgi:hypothetical protein
MCAKNRRISARTTKRTAQARYFALASLPTNCRRYAIEYAPVQHADVVMLDRLFRMLPFVRERIPELLLGVHQFVQVTGGSWSSISHSTRIRQMLAARTAQRARSAMRDDGERRRLLPSVEVEIGRPRADGVD